MTTPQKKNVDSKRKALIFIEDGSFTFDNRVIRESTALAEAGWSITVICPKYPTDPLYRRVSDKVRCYFYPKPTAESAIGHFIEHSVSLITGGLLTFWVFLRHGFSVFHACNPMDVLWIIALPYKLFRKKFIFDQHDLCPELYLSRGEGDEKHAYYRILILLERASYWFADIVLAPNESYKRIAMERGRKSADQVFVVRNGPDLSKFKLVPPRTDLKQKDEVLVGYLGNMNIQDGVDLILEAAQYIASTLNRHDIKFVLVGGGSSQEGLRQQATEMGLTTTVTFTGRISDDEMLATISACDLCVQPDPYNPLNDRSTMNKVLEYMALEKPIVAFDLKETRFSCGDAALYAKPNEAKSFADKTLRLADDPDLRLLMGRRGRERIGQQLSWEFSIPHLLSGYALAKQCKRKR